MSCYDLKRQRDTAGLKLLRTQGTSAIIRENVMRRHGLQIDNSKSANPMNASGDKMPIIGTTTITTYNGVKQLLKALIAKQLTVVVFLQIL